MPAHAVTVHLPETLYERFRQRAEWTRRSLESELLDAIASAAAPTEAEQEALAERLLSEIHSDRQWDEAFARSGDLLSRLAEEALAEHQAGLTQDLDPDRE